MDQAKWYYIQTDNLIRLEDTVVKGYFKNRIKKIRFHQRVLIYQLKEAGLKRVNVDGPWIDFFCGQKKLNKLIEEAHLLGLEDELLIFRKEK